MLRVVRGVVLSGLFVVLLTLGCGEESVDSTTKADPYANLLDNVTFIPDSGPPGTIIELQGLAPLPGDTNWTLYIGGQFAPLIRQSGGPVYTAIPLFFANGDSTWSARPDAPVSVTIHYNDQPVDSVMSAISVDSLPHAPHAIDNLLDNLTSGTEAIRSIAETLDIHDTLLLGTCDAMEEILFTGENSLSAILNGTSPLIGADSVSRELFSALLASSGAADMFSRWADTLNATSAAVKRTIRSAGMSSDVTDEGLAARMQLYQLIRDFGSLAIGNTALDWQKVSAVIGAVGIVFPVVGPLEFIVSYFVAELDFIVNKLVVACFPSEITKFTLDFPVDTLHPGDSTSAVVYISARNDPPNITPLDIVQQVVGGIALVDWIRRLGVSRRVIQSLGNIDDIVEDILVWFIGVINNVLSANYHAPAMLDVSLPHMTWDSVKVENPGLIDLVSPDLSRIEYMDGSFNGFAKDAPGTVPLQMRTQPPGPNMWSPSVLQAAGYSGGAFGDDLVLSDPDSVVIVPELTVSATLPSPLLVGSDATLQVTTQYGTSTGGSRPAEGVDLQLDIIGGTLSTSSGVSDNSGEFSASVEPGAGSDSVVIRVIASDSYGNSDSASVLSYVNNSSISDISFALGGYLQTDARYERPYHSVDDTTDERFGYCDTTETFPHSDALSRTISLSSHVSRSRGYAQAEASCNVSLGVTSIGNGITFEGSIDANGSIGYSVDNSGVTNVDSAYVSGGSVASGPYCEISFRIDGSADLTITHSVPMGINFDGQYIISDSGTWNTTIASGGQHGLRVGATGFELFAGSAHDGASYSASDQTSGSFTLTITPQSATNGQLIGNIER